MTCGLPFLWPACAYGRECWLLVDQGSHRRHSAAQVMLTAVLRVRRFSSRATCSRRELTAAIATSSTSTLFMAIPQSRRRRSVVGWPIVSFAVGIVSESRRASVVIDQVHQLAQAGSAQRHMVANHAELQQAEGRAAAA